MDRTYISIDLKSFYASVECVERGLDPLTTNLVVADERRTTKTICLAVSPALKACGIPGRPRLFEVVRMVREINRERERRAGHALSGSSCFSPELRENPDLALDYITAIPRMAYYIEYSTHIFQIYLRYVSPEDIHVYSIDEVFIDATDYLKLYNLSPRKLTEKILEDVLAETGVTATAGIGTNLYLSKVAMDIVAKHAEANENGARIAELDEMSYRKLLWNHRPLTDFWRVGRGYARKLEEHGMFTMGDVARCSIGDDGDYHNEKLLYDLFGVNAELLIDHAWGWEPCRIADIKAYRPETNSVGSGQVLHEPYDCEKARLVVREMTDLLVLDLVDKGLVTNQIVLTIGYDRENLTDPEIRKSYKGPVKRDHYGRMVPKHAHGSVNLERYTSSARVITEAVMELYDQITNPILLVRRLNVTAGRVIAESEIPEESDFVQLDLFTDYEALEQQKQTDRAALEKEKKAQQAMLDIKKKFGKNAVLRGMNLQEGATARQRNSQIGGHEA